ncbi:unnamed protein product [Malus baccata var. baccata]
MLLFNQHLVRCGRRRRIIVAKKNKKTNIVYKNKELKPSIDFEKPNQKQVTNKIKMKTFTSKTPNSTEKKKRYRRTYLQYRCNMTGFSDSMEAYKPMLEERKDICEQLEKTSFWSLIKLYMDDFLVVTKRKKKSDTDLSKVIKCYDPKEQKFRFGDRDARGITSDDVALIFGLNNDGVELPNTDKSSKSGKEDRFIEKYFHNVERVKKNHILQAYQKSLVDRTLEGARDTASIICAHLIQPLLFANSGTYITWSFVQICGKLDDISKYNWAKGVRDYLFKMIDKSQIKMRKLGDESTTNGCTILILYWICLKSNIVETINGRENMVPAIGRWDPTMIYQAIRDVKVEDIKFDKLYIEEYLKLNLDYQTHIHGIDTTITSEMFNQFEKCTGMEQMRFMVLKEMMMHVIDNLQTAFVVSGQITGKLKRDIEKLKEEKKLNKKKINDMDAEI